MVDTENAAEAHEFRGWEISETGTVEEPQLTLQKRGRAPLLMFYRPGTPLPVVLEFAKTRILEADMRSAGKDRRELVRQDYDDHIAESRAAQRDRGERRLRAEVRAARAAGVAGTGRDESED